ncbi:hypothetical protein FA13DRAFT_1527580 [Coprinellus micaceus]|uniref:Uncharacterized protein n=1 Tax=Coprinellus micaceus TaxID=71717 RepID=A0A4Y7SJP9_COPMI|nr:hypothetical protein FA13DRAFT_1527580 [Coprinellus micaceus]
MLKSPHLTHLTLHSVPSFLPSTFPGFLTFLRQARQLISLHLNLPYQEPLLWDEVGGKPESLVEIPFMKTFEVISAMYSPLAVVASQSPISGPSTPSPHRGFLPSRWASALCVIAGKTASS